LAGVSWSNVRRFSSLTGYRFDGTESEPLNQPTNGTQPESRQEAFSVPVQLRGEPIGRLRIKPTSEGYSWTDDEIAIIQATAERVALAIENARLVLESQERASKELIIGEITGKIGSSINLRNVLQTAVEELGHAIPGSEVVIQLSPKTDSEAK
jgi:hypothetical protein